MDVFSYLITGGFTLLATLSGVFIANLFQNRRLRTQLTHERELKNREREMSLRKDVYLAAAEAVSAGLFSVGQFANFNVPHEKVTAGYLDKAPSISKVHIIAKEETVKAVINFSNELNGVFLRLFARRFPLVLQKQHLEFLSGQIDGYTKEQSRMVELMKQYNMEGVNDPHKWDMIQQTFDFERGRAEQTSQQIDRQNASLIAKQLQYMEEVFDELIKLGRLVIPMLLSIRKELELPIDETEFRRISDEGTAKQVEALKEFIKQLKSATAGHDAEGDAPSP